MVWVGGLVVVGGMTTGAGIGSIGVIIVMTGSTSYFCVFSQKRIVLLMEWKSGG